MSTKRIQRPRKKVPKYPNNQAPTKIVPRLQPLRKKVKLPKAKSLVHGSGGPEQNDPHGPNDSKVPNFKLGKSNTANNAALRKRAGQRQRFV